MRDDASSFLANTTLFFSTDPIIYADDQLKINYIVSFLRRDAFKWYDAVIYRPGLTFFDLPEFEELFKMSFREDLSSLQGKAFADLRRLTQIKCCVYWQTIKMYSFKEGLKPEVKLHLVGLCLALRTLSRLIRAAVEYDDALFCLLITTKPSTAKIAQNTRQLCAPNVNHGNKIGAR